jgi:hypothetical protein
MRPSPVDGTIEGSPPYATLREPCFGFGVCIRTFSEAAEIDCESLPHENLAEIGYVADTARRDNAAEPVTGPGQTPRCAACDQGP